MLKCLRQVVEESGPVCISLLAAAVIGLMWEILAEGTGKTGLLDGVGVGRLSYD